MIRIVIVDDEFPNHSYLQRLISLDPELSCEACFSSAAKALEYIILHKPDLVLLDIEMPSLSGTAMAKEIKAQLSETEIIFTTAYPEHAVEAFKVGALHYLLKPISENDFKEAILRMSQKQRITEPQNLNNWQIEMMGSFKVFHKTTKKTLSWPTKKSEELFAYFVYQNGKTVEKTVLWDLLWEEVDERRTQRYLHNEIYRIKNTLKSEGIEAQIQFQNGAYRLDLSEFDCDVHQIEAFIDKSRGLDEKQQSAYEKIFDLYKGEVLQTRDYLWALPWQQSIALGMKEIALDLIEFYIEGKQLARGEERLRYLLNHTPWDEDYFEKLLKIYYSSGDWIKLKSSFEGFSALLQKELNTAPRKSLRTLYERYVLDLVRASTSY